MLYLAEVQQKPQFVGTKTELKLLACQRNDQNWVAVPGDELVLVQSGDANNLKDGQIVLAEIANKNVQRIIPDSSRVLVSRLEGFSRSLEKAKKEKDETESMRLSLEAQFEELSKRQIEVESAREQVATLDEDFQRLQQERQEVQVLRQTAEQKRQEAERIKKELAEVRQEMEAKEAEIKSREAELKKGALTPEQGAKIKDLVNQLAGVIPATNLAQRELKSVQEILGRLRQFEGDRTLAMQKSNEVKQQFEQWEKLQQEAQKIQNSVGEVKTELKVQKTNLNN
ncbi:MAG TPA: pilus motility taxis protein HmpF, partial [Allocoleopsis sp.]